MAGKVEITKKVKVKVKVKSMFIIGKDTSSCTYKCKFEGCDYIYVGNKKISIGVNDRNNPTKTCLFNDNVDYIVNEKQFDFISNHSREEFIITFFDTIEVDSETKETEVNTEDIHDEAIAIVYKPEVAGNEKKSYIIMCNNEKQNSKSITITEVELLYD